MDIYIYIHTHTHTYSRLERISHIPGANMYVYIQISYIYLERQLACGCQDDSSCAIALTYRIGM